MENGKDLFQIKRNFTALTLFLVVILLLIDIIMRVSPSLIKPDSRQGYISAVGYHQQLSDGSAYYIYTVFESNGDVYQCWWDGKIWNQKKVTNYKAATLVDEHE